MDVDAIRRDFPILQRDWGDRPPLVYLDSGCMSLKPRQVIEAMREYYELDSSCAGRSVHSLASQVSRRVDRARSKMASFIGASRPEEVVFLRNTTEAINLVANSLGLRRGDAVVISDREHNSNLVPWLRLREISGVILRVVPCSPDGDLDTDDLQDHLSRDDVRLVSMAHTANLDGTTLPMEAISQMAHDKGALVLADAAQSVPSRPVDARRMGVDLMAFSVHKMLGPTGVGVLWGRHELLGSMPPYNVGGDTVSRVTQDSAEYLLPPNRFEAGLQDYAGIYGSEAAVEYLSRIGMEEVMAHEISLNRRATAMVSDLPGVSILGPQEPELRGGVISLVIDGVGSHEVGMAMDEIGNVAVRTGRMCNHAWFERRGIEGALRASFYIYNEGADVDAFVNVLGQAMVALRGH